MSPRLDAHAHFFYPGFVDQMPENCRRRDPDEITLYQALAQKHDIEQVLAVAYEGDSWASGNNRYLATLAAQHDWVRPTAFVAEPSQLTVEQLKVWQDQKFVGISLYLFNAEAVNQLNGIASGVWQWLSDQAWLISVNSTADFWNAWPPILQRFPEIRLLIAHLGIPAAVTAPPSLDQARAALTPVLQMAAFPQVHVKFSGFYALAQPGYAYPHTAAWPYAQVTSAAFGNSRIIWASDFSPALEFVSFPQAVEIVANMPWLSANDLTAIYHDNLAQLLATVDERKPDS